MSGVFSYKRQAFSPTGRFIVRKKLLVGDRTFDPGETFPWRRLKFDERRMKLLFETGYLRMKEDGEPS